MPCFASAVDCTRRLVSCLAFCCCIMNLAAAIDCSFHDTTGVLSCVLGRREAGGAKIAVVLSSDADHSHEALDFINSWQRFPPCSQPPHFEASPDAQAMPVNRELLPALVLRLSCDWGFKNCDRVAHDLMKVAEPHMHCFSELILKMNIIMFRNDGSGSTVADCLECVFFVCVCLCCVVFALRRAPSPAAPPGAAAGSPLHPHTCFAGLGKAYLIPNSTRYTRATTTRLLPPTERFIPTACSVRDRSRMQPGT